MSPSRLLPCLAVVELGAGAHQSTTLFSVAEGKPITCGLDDLDALKSNSQAALCPTPQGWILVRDRDGSSTYLLDPQSRQRVQLPPLTIDPDLLVYCNCLLSDKPTDRGCVVLLVEPGDTFLWYCLAGEEGGAWIKFDYDIGTQGDESRPEKIVIAPIAACRGKFYFNSVSKETGVLEFCPAGPVFSSIGAGYAVPEKFESARVFMLESDGELYKVRLLRHGGAYDEARVYKMDFSDHHWHLVDDLGGRAFFVALYNFGASCLADEEYGIQKNCVYSALQAEKSFKVFDVRDGTAEVHNLEGAVQGTVDRVSWMLPTDTRA